LEVDTSDTSLTPRLLLFSAKHPEALKQMVRDHEAYNLQNPSKLQDMAFSLAVKREVLSHRAFSVANAVDDWTLLIAPRPGSYAPSKVVFVFSGQGAQWAQMGKGLFQNVPTFRQSIENMDRFLHALHDGPAWSLVGKSFF
jgi:acyl transferase domain-containing protein